MNREDYIKVVSRIESTLDTDGELVDGFEKFVFFISSNHGYDGGVERYDAALLAYDLVKRHNRNLPSFMTLWGSERNIDFIGGDDYVTVLDARGVKL